MRFVLKKTTLLLFFLFFSHYFYAQNGFSFYGLNEKRQEVRFKFVNNLIVFPLTINGKELSFILDTGVNKTILFSLLASDSLGINNVERAALRGLGNGRPVEALLSRNNTFKIKNMSSNAQTLYVILEDKFDLSSKMGVTIHGIIGYNLFRHVIVKIDYNKRKLIFYNPKYYKLEKCKKCETFPLIFFRNKPYIDAKVQLDESSDNLIDVKLLIDSGGSDALWLFENSKEDIKPPTKFFDDILGEGLSGTIYGKRSRISKFVLGNYHIPKPTVSYLDSLSSINARKYKERNGSLGGNILKRFKVWIDYPNKRLTLKKTGSFTTGFNYNMSGITVAYSGKTLVKEASNSEIKIYGGSTTQISSVNQIDFVTSFRYYFRPVYKISNIVPGSPADEAGLKVNDVFMTINSQQAFKYDLEHIIGLFQERNNKRIWGKVKRGTEVIKFRFRLKKEI